MPGFFEQVYRLVRQVPPGRVTSYGAIARLLDHPRAARTVGWALHSLRPPVPPDIMANYDRRIAWLKDLKKGEADLPVEDAASGGHAPMVEGPDRRSSWDDGLGQL